MRAILSNISHYFFLVMFVVLSPMRWLLGGYGGKDKIVFFSYPNFVYVWPVIALGLLFPVLDNYLSAEVVTWVWLVVVCIVALALGFDFDRNYSAVIIITLVAVWLGMRNIEATQNIPVLGHVYRYFAGLDAVASSGLPWAISLILAVPYAFMLVWVRLNNKWVADVQTLERHKFGHTDINFTLGAKTVRTAYPDWLEVVIGLSGNIILADSRGRGVVQKIDNVVFAPLVKRRMDQFLRAWGVQNRAAAEAEDMESAAAAAEEDEPGGA